MRALTVDYQEKGLREREIAEPSPPAGTEVLFRVQETGVCGTDRELARLRIGAPPAGETYLVLGHEAFGQVIAVGSAVTGFRPGDWLAPLVRRPCALPCHSCGRNRVDLCLTGEYRERGIQAAHGYFCEYAVDEQQHLVCVPSAAVSRGVLLEPLSVVEKAVLLALSLHQGTPRSALVLGAGTIGILAALVLQTRGIQVAVHSLEDRESYRVRLLRKAGIEYREKLEGKADLIIEAAGNSEIALAAVGALASLGVYIVLGASVAAGEFPFRQLILNNQTIAGSVNTSPESMQSALSYLVRLDASILDGLIRREKFEGWRHSILGPQCEQPKVVHVVS